MVALCDVAIAQHKGDTVNIKADSAIRFRTPDVLLFSFPNLETMDASPAESSASLFIRSQSNPLITVDGIPQNPVIFASQSFREFLPLAQPLAFDISRVCPQTYLSGDRIASGVYLNSVDLATQDLSRPGDSLKVFANNITSALSDASASGYSITTNAGVIIRRNKVGGRVSVNNGLRDNYIANMGTNRYGANAKVLIQPVKPVKITGYLDYSRRSDFARVDSSQFDNTNLFSYVAGNYDGRLVDVQARLSKSIRKEIVSRKIVDIREYAQPAATIRRDYRQDVDYENNATYYDLSLTANPFANSNWDVEATLGAKSWTIREPSTVQDKTVNVTTGDTEEMGHFIARPMMTDRKMFATVHAKNGVLTILYTSDFTSASFSGINSPSENKTTYSNHFGSIKIDFFRKRNLWINAMDINLKGGVINRIVVGRYVKPGSNAITWINPDPGINAEVAVNWTAATNIISGFVKGYSIRYDHYLMRGGFGDFSFPLDYVGINYNIGQVSRNGIETGLAARVVNTDKASWFLRGSFCRNNVKVDPVFERTNNNGYNSLASLHSGLVVGAVSFDVNFVHKNGFDIIRNDFAIAAEGPLETRILQDGYVSHVDTNGKPTTKSPGRFDDVYEVSFTIIDNMQMSYSFYHIRGINSAVVGLSFNRIRNLYSFMNEIGNYAAMDRPQVPSFFNVVSVSVGVQL
jgi:hypothetical protein